MLAGKKVLVIGGHGFIGRHLVPLLRERGCKIVAPLKDAYDIAEPFKAIYLLADVMPAIVINLAAHATNTRYALAHSGEVLHKNLQIGSHLIEACRLAKWPLRLILLHHVAVYPGRLRELAEADLWAGPPEDDYFAYAAAKRAVIAQGMAYRHQYGLPVSSLVSAEGYGQHEQQGPRRGRAVASIINAILRAGKARAKAVRLYGLATDQLHLTHGHDIASGVVAATACDDAPSLVNLPAESAVSRQALTEMLADLLGFDGELIFDEAAPVVPVRKLGGTLATVALSYSPRISLRDGLKQTTAWYHTWFKP